MDSWVVTEAEAKAAERQTATRAKEEREGGILKALGRRRRGARRAEGAGPELALFCRAPPRPQGSANERAFGAILIPPRPGARPATMKHAPLVALSLYLLALIDAKESGAGLNVLVFGDSQGDVGPTYELLQGTAPLPIALSPRPSPRRIAPSDRPWTPTRPPPRPRPPPPPAPSSRRPLREWRQGDSEERSGRRDPRVWVVRGRELGLLHDYQPRLCQRRHTSTIATSPSIVVELAATPPPAHPPPPGTTTTTMPSPPRPTMHSSEHPT